MMAPNLSTIGDDQNQVVYDDPSLDSTLTSGQQFTDLRLNHQHHQPQGLHVLPNGTQPTSNSLAHNPNRRSMIMGFTQQVRGAHDRLDIGLPHHTMMMANKPNQIVRPHSMAFDQRQHTTRQQYPIDVTGHRRPPPSFAALRKQIENDDQLDDELYNVLSGDEDDAQNNPNQQYLQNHTTTSNNNSRSHNNEHDAEYVNDSNNVNGAETSDSSQRTNEILSSEQGDRSFTNNSNNNIVNSPIMLNSRHSQDNNDYYT